MITSAKWDACRPIARLRVPSKDRAPNQAKARASITSVAGRFRLSWPCVWAKLAVRMVEGIRHGAPQPPKIPGRWINGALFRLSRIEHKTITALSLPFGSSLMLVGTKRDEAH